MKLHFLACSPVSPDNRRVIKDDQIDEKSIETMENLIAQAASGTHLLFDNFDLKKVLSIPKEDLDFFDKTTLTKVQDLMIQLIARKNHYDKVAFLDQLDDETYEILVRSYYHLVEHTAFSQSDFSH